jgi:hypothetical protein
VKNTQDKGKGSLRNAIKKANSTPGPDEIHFNIRGGGVKTIKPASPLPPITDPVKIDGYTQPGASVATSTTDAVLKIQLNGTNAGPAHGLVIEADDSTITGLVINRFVGNGVFITGSGAKVLGNFVGTNAGGTEALGNGLDGVEVSGASASTVGGTRAAARNVISGNTDDGVEFQGDTLGNEVLGNFIGTNANGTNTPNNVGNGVHGVDFRDGAFDNTVGGTASGSGNRIAHNGEDGVSVSASNSAGNRVLSNFIFSNGGTTATTNLGIDLGTSGVTANDTDDPDTGANNLQNFPVITSATRSNSTGFTTISGTLNSNPSQNYTVQCFVAVPDPSGHGEGQILEAQDTTVTTDANGDADGADSFSCVTNFPVAVGQTVTTTATNTSGTATGTSIGDTSEFSLNVGVVAGP